MKYQTIEQLSYLCMNAMKLEYQRQTELPAMQDLGFDDRFAMIVNKQYEAKQTSKVKRLIKDAKLREPTACLEHIDYDPVRNLKKKDIAQLSDCNWIREGQNLIALGATGVGKTYLVSAFGRQACMLGFKVRSYRMTRLLTDLMIGRGDGSYNKIIKDLLKPNLLILDDFGLRVLDVETSQDLNEVIEERHMQHKSIAMTAQLPIENWPDVIMNKIAGDALMDRVVRNAYRFNLRGPSRRPTLQQVPEEKAAAAGEGGDTMNT